MKTVKWIVAIGIFIGFMVNSCFPICGCEPGGPDTRVDVIVKNKTGEDMLNPATTGFFARNTMILYFLRDGKKIFVQGQFDYSVSKGLQTNGIYDSDRYHWPFFTNNAIVDNQATTLLEFMNVKTDTLTCFYSEIGEMTEVRVNGKTAWKPDGQEERIVEITLER